MIATLVKLLLPAWALLWSVVAGAQVAIPPLTARVIDQTATLTAEQIATLEKTLQTFEARKGSQLAVLLVPTTAPEGIEQYALRVAEQWRLGRKGVDDGALLLIAKEDRAVRIEVGYGLEGALNDATSKRITNDIIVPFFKRGDFYGGITAGVERIIRVIDGEPLPEPGRQSPAGGNDAQQYFPLILIAAFVVGNMLRGALGRMFGAVATGGIVGIIAWLFISSLLIAFVAGLAAFLFTLLGGGPRSGLGRYPGGFGTGGHGGGIFGGGGFRGGGGTFGGGGASGRW